MAFFSIFVKLKDTATSKAFKVTQNIDIPYLLLVSAHTHLSLYPQEYDLNKDGFISYREFEKV